MKISASLAILFAGRRSALALAHLLFSAVILVNATTARADLITYNIINPGAQTDTNGGLDSIVGSTITITGSGFAGYGANDTIPNADITLLAYSVTIQNMLNGNVVPVTFTGSGPLGDFAGSGGLPTFTGSQIFLHDAYLSLNKGGGTLYWRSDSGIFYGFVSPVIYFNNTDQTQLNDVFGSGSDNWLIGQVPEPATLTLLGSALLGLGVVYLRRRARKMPEMHHDSLNFRPIANLLTAVLFLGALLLAFAPASADWPGSVPKWTQLNPDTCGVSSYIDEHVDNGTTADDFLCTSPLPITEIRFCGYCWDDAKNQPMDYPAQFYITFWSDVGRTLSDESHPDSLLKEIYVNPAQSDDPNKIGFQFLGNHNYIINLPEQDWFPQLGSHDNPIVYWIGIQGVMPNNENPEEFIWLFRNRNDETLGDDAVSADETGDWGHWGWQSSDSVSPDYYYGAFPSDWWKSADMAFELSTTVPEPSAFVLLDIGVFAVAFYGWRRRK
ncbi:MAG: PEP-CTERM sorting domain-containing protein [Thermoguttaceae bacterium]|jgi:hypothetical protein